MPPVKTTIQNARESSRFSELRFPEDLGPIAMVFNFFDYSYVRAGGGTGFSSQLRLSDSIILPLPQNLENQYGIKIQEAELDAGGLIAQGLSSAEQGQGAGLIESAVSGSQQALSAVTEQGKSVAGGDFSGVSDFLKGASFFSRNSLDSILPGAAQAVDVSSGTTVNPQQTLAFDGVDLKNFTFNWSLSPKNAKDSDSLRRIERKFKQHILPYYNSLTDTGSALDRAFLGYPDIIHIYFKGIDNNFYFQFKPGMVSDFSVNYSPNGNVILQGGKPAAINMSMTFKEARIHTRGDYGGTSPGVANVGGGTNTVSTSQNTDNVGPNDGQRG